jgi:hypothetical protein
MPEPDLNGQPSSAIRNEEPASYRYFSEAEFQEALRQVNFTERLAFLESDKRKLRIMTNECVEGLFDSKVEPSMKANGEEG